MMHTLSGQPVILGAGLAGLLTALCLAPRPVVVLCQAPVGEQASSTWAQGGIAASLGADDTAVLHLQDTLQAGDGLSDEDAAKQVTGAAAAMVEQLVQLGAGFDRDAKGAITLGLEAAHSRRRIVHAAGDGTGREIMRALILAVRATPSITILENTVARRLIVQDGALAGLLASQAGIPLLLPTDAAIVATGGVGSLYQHSTNPLGSWGSGLMLAARAGAILQDLEFVQFHPTALDCGGDPMPLVSEAVRGEGATLIDETGQRFMPASGISELAPRDMVARAIWHHLASGRRVFLDARAIANFSQRFPAIAGFCRADGIDPAVNPIPVRPAAHYHMGGIAVDAHGRSSVPGLWACGEAACTGLHGANRLASNSLLEAGVCARIVAQSIVEQSIARPPSRSAASLSTPLTLPPEPDTAPVRRIMSEGVGVLRDASGLRHAIAALRQQQGAMEDPALIGTMIAVAALRREESRGAHYRTDYPGKHAQATHSRLTWQDARDYAQNAVPDAA